MVSGFLKKFTVEHCRRLNRCALSFLSEWIIRMEIADFEPRVSHKFGLI